MIDCYVIINSFGNLLSGPLDHKINAFEMCCYRRMLRISRTSHTTNIDVLQKIGVKETTMLNNLKNIKVVLCGTHNENTSDIMIL